LDATATPHSLVSGSKATIEKVLQFARSSTTAPEKAVPAIKQAIGIKKKVHTKINFFIIMTPSAMKQINIK
jgi:hypothetical protein